MIEIGKNYNVRELKEMFGKEWAIQIGIRTYPKICNKPVIKRFDDFDNDTKSIYIQIYNLIKEKNQNQNFNVWATGSRINGTWRTPEESEELAKKYNQKIKYSDYDYISDANRLPTPTEFFEKIGVKVDFAGCEEKVLIISN